eukprot:TRINITY_DN6575_c0_g1_i1.p1 TRINITY_DN6575_c0_g1~~TRINITY_DN6575_c0_g1_i1.p1  ORF type:complete len:146 (-),score=20.32 TRINITY_DN6575_c0_g1_i1:330-767(-)
MDLNEPLIGCVINGSWVIKRKIGLGGFGVVFKAKSLATEANYAVKIESQPTRLWEERKVYEAMKGVDGFPTCHWFGLSTGRTGSFYTLVMDYLGPSLPALLHSFKSLSLRTVLSLSFQMLDRLRILHEKGFVHRYLIEWHQDCLL